MSIITELTPEKLAEQRMPIRNQPMNIALLSPAWPAGKVANGIASYVGNLVPSLMNQHVQPIVLTSNIGDLCTDRFVRRLRLANEAEINWHGRILRKMARAGWWDRRAEQAIVRELNALLGDEAIELLEMEETFGWAYEVARQGPVPVVVRLHGPWFLMGPPVGGDRENGFRRRVKREGLGIRDAAGVTAPSRDVLERTRAQYGLPLKEAAVIANPILPCDMKNQWQPRECDPNLVLFVGRFDGHKGGDVMIDAFAIVAKRHPFARLLFVGSDRGIEDVSGKRLGIQEYIAKRFDSVDARRVEWMGTKSRDEVVALRRIAAVTVVCSRYETFGMTATEAMAAGCPLVATNVGGLPEIVQHELNGLLCQPNDPADLAEKILTLLEHPELAAKLGAQAQTDATSRYHPDIIARQTIEFYQEVLQRWHKESHHQ